MAEQDCATLAWIWGEEHDIIVDNKLATGNNGNTLFFPDEEYRFKEKSIKAIFAASFMRAFESVLASSGSETQWLAG